MSRNELTRGEATGALAALIIGFIGTVGCGTTVAALENLAIPTAETPADPTEGMHFVESALNAVLGENRAYLKHLREGEYTPAGTQQMNSWSVVIKAGDSPAEAERLLNILKGATPTNAEGIITPQAIRQSMLDLDPGLNLPGGLSYQGSPADWLNVVIEGRFTETDAQGWPTPVELHVIDQLFNHVPVSEIRFGSKDSFVDAAALKIQP
jgi:hypothetical protein